MEIAYSKEAQRVIAFWKTSGKIGIQNKISKIIQSIQQEPFSGIGKPEPLKYELSGYWSRRINKEHRVIYQVKEE